MTDKPPEFVNRRRFLIGGTGTIALGLLGARMLMAIARQWENRPPEVRHDPSPADIVKVLSEVFDNQVAAIKSGKADYLSLAYVTNPDEKLRSVAGLKGLKSIRMLGNDKVTDAGIETFATFPDLESVNLDFVDVLASWPLLLKNCSGLQVVRIAPKLPPQFEVAKILELPQLQLLSLTVDPHGDQTINDQTEAWLEPPWSAWAKRNGSRISC